LNDIAWTRDHLYAEAPRAAVVAQPHGAGA
jgi:hypothetical protein